MTQVHSEYIHRDSDTQPIFSRFKTLISYAKPASFEEAETRSRHCTLGYIENNEFIQYSIWKTSAAQLEQHGIGLRLYFDFVKLSSIAFLLISIFSLYLIVSNSMGNNISGYQNNLLVYITVANQLGASPYERNLTHANTMLPKIQENLRHLWIIDYLISLIFLAFIIFYTYYSRKTARVNLRNKNNIREFAIAAKGFEEDVDKEKIVEYFSQFGDVTEVSLARKYSGKLLKYKKVYEICSTIGHSEPSSKRNSRAITKLTQAAENIDYGYGLDKTNDELPVVRVFVVFASIQAKKLCIEKSCNFHKASSKNKVIEMSNLSGINPKIEIKNAPDPSVILWENLEYSSWKKLKIRNFFLPRRMG